MVLQVGLQPVLGDFSCVLGGQATKSIVLVMPNDLFMLIWAGRPDSLDQWSIRLAFSQSWVVLAAFWVARPQNPLSVWGQKNLFCVYFGQEWHLPPQHPGFGSKLSPKGKPGTCAHFQKPCSLLSISSGNAFRTAAQILYSAYIFLKILMVCLH